MYTRYTVSQIYFHLDWSKSRRAMTGCHNSCYPELCKCGFFPANPPVQTNFYRNSFAVHYHVQWTNNNNYD